MVNKGKKKKKYTEHFSPFKTLNARAKPPFNHFPEKLASHPIPAHADVQNQNTKLKIDVYSYFTSRKSTFLNLNTTGRRRANSESARTLKILTRQTRTRLLPVGLEAPMPVQ